MRQRRVTLHANAIASVAEAVADIEAGPVCGQQRPQPQPRLALAVFALQAEQRFDDASWVGWRLAELLPLTLPQRQRLLQEDDPDRRLDDLLGLLS